MPGDLQLDPDFLAEVFAAEAVGDEGLEHVCLRGAGEAGGDQLFDMSG